MSLSLLLPALLLILCIAVAASEANSTAAAVESNADKATQTPRQKKVETATFAMG
jgi:hypothetical protein